MTLKELKLIVAGGADVEAIVNAADPMVYLLQILVRGEGASELPTTLQDAHGKNLVYRNRYSADQAFARVGIARVTLVHESAYGEMVGMDAGGNRMEHRYPVKLDPGLD